MRYLRLALVCAASLFLFLALTSVLDETAQAYSGPYGYRSQSPVFTSDRSPSFPTSDPGGDWYHAVFCSGGTQAHAEVILRVCDNIPFHSDEDQGGGEAWAKKKQEWRWDGPEQEAPGASFGLYVEGQGGINAAGTATAGVGLGVSASASGSGDSIGLGSTTSVGDFNAEVQAVGGTCYHNTSGSLSGGADWNPKGGGLQASLSAGSSGVGSFARTGTWAIEHQDGGAIGTGATTVLISTKVICRAQVAATANGSVIGPATSYATISSSGEIDASIMNFVMN